jgi:hypothetical protein
VNKTEAIEAVEIGNLEWIERAEAVITPQIKERKKRGGVKITSDWLWAMSRPAGTPREPRAMGALMRRLQKAGVIYPLNKWVPSSRSACHSRPVRVWGVV